MKNQKLRKVISGIISVIMAFSMTALAACADSEDDIQGGGNGQTDITDTPDEETPDQGNPDEGNPDEENPDEGTPDEGNPDEGNPDEGNPDEGTPDDSTPDTENPDEGNPDQGTPDEENPDEGNPDEGNPDEGNPDEENPDEGTPDEGNPDDSTPDVNPDEDDFDSALYNEILDKLEWLMSDQVRFMSMDLWQDTDVTTTNYTMDGGIYNQTSQNVYSYNAGLGLNIDLLTGDKDVISETISDEFGIERESHSYELMRNNVWFSAVSETEIDSFDGVVLKESDYMVDSFGNEIMYGLNTLISMSSTVIVPLSVRYDALAFSNGGISVNLNGIIYGLYSDFYKIINILNGDTTLSELFEEDIVKGIIEDLSAGKSAESAAQLLAEFLDSGILNAIFQNNSFVDQNNLVQIIGILKSSIIEAEENESVYDYVLRWLNSEEVAAAFGIKEGTVGDLTIENLVKMIDNDISFEVFKAGILQILDAITCTEEAFEFRFTNSNTGFEGYFSFSSAVLDIGLNQNGDVDIDLLFSLIMNNLIGGGSGGQHGKPEYLYYNSINGDFSIRLNYSSENSLLIDLSGAYAEISDGYIIDNTSQGCLLGSFTDGEESYDIYLVVNATGFKEFSLSLYRAIYGATDIVDEFFMPDYSKLTELDGYTFDGENLTIKGGQSQINLIASVTEISFGEDAVGVEVEIFMPEDYEQNSNYDIYGCWATLIWERHYTSIPLDDYLDSKAREEIATSNLID